MNEPMLKVSGLNAFYGRAHILFDVGLEVGRGEVVALMGRNGAGKSTTMKAVTGLLPRRHGEVTFRGRNIAALPPYKIARMGMGFVPEDRRVFEEFAILHHALEFADADEIVLTAMLFTGTRRPRRRRDAHGDVVLLLQQPARQGGFACARWRGQHEHQAAALDLRTHSTFCNCSRN